jgi:hypothetical protein
VVPELIKKKEARDADLKKKKSEEGKKKKDERAAKKQEYLKKGEQYYLNDVAERKKLIENKRKAKLSGNYYVPAEAKVAFVIRIKGYIRTS